MEINMQATIGTCNQYLREVSGELSEISVVISPKKVIADDASTKLQYIDGCNMWKSCFNKGCWYSIAGRQTKRT
jgi:hypothetical protein